VRLLTLLLLAHELELPPAGSLLDRLPVLKPRPNGEQTTDDDD
jgi:hypothetical protein